MDSGTPPSGLSFQCPAGTETVRSNRSQTVFAGSSAAAGQVSGPPPVPLAYTGLCQVTLPWVASSTPPAGSAARAGGAGALITVRARTVAAPTVATTDPRERRGKGRTLQ